MAIGALKLALPRGDDFQIHRPAANQRNFRLDDVDLERHRLRHDDRHAPRGVAPDFDLVLPAHQPVRWRKPPVIN